MSTVLERDAQTIVTEMLDAEFGGLGGFLRGLRSGQTWETMQLHEALFKELEVLTNLSTNTLSSIIDIVSKIPMGPETDLKVLVNDLLINPEVQLKYGFILKPRDVHYGRVEKFLPAVVEAVYDKQTRSRKNA